MLFVLLAGLFASAFSRHCSATEVGWERILRETGYRMMKKAYGNKQITSKMVERIRTLKTHNSQVIAGRKEQ